MMKKWTVLTMAMIFALGVTSMVFAADEKLPADVKAAPKKVTLPPGAASEEKIQMEEAKKKATVEKKDAVGTPMPGMSVEEKRNLEDTKKKATVKKKPVVKKPMPGMSVEEKRNLEDLNKKSTADKMQEKKQEAAPAAPAAEVPAKK